MPRDVSSLCYNDIGLRFTGTATPLAAIWERDSRIADGMGDIPSGWSSFWHLADQEYLQGGGWICIEEESGRLVVVDLDQPEPVYLLSATLSDFFTTLAHFVEWSETTGGLPDAIEQLSEDLREQSVVPVQELEPFWMNFVDATLDGDPINLIVSLTPLTVRPGEYFDRLDRHP